MTLPTFTPGEWDHVGTHWKSLSVFDSSILDARYDADWIHGMMLMGLCERDAQEYHAALANGESR